MKDKLFFEDKVKEAVRSGKDYVSFQVYGYSAEQVKRMWTNLKKREKWLPRAKKIDSAEIHF